MALPRPGQPLPKFTLDQLCRASLPSMFDWFSTRVEKPGDRTTFKWPIKAAPDREMPVVVHYRWHDVQVLWVAREGDA